MERDRCEDSTMTELLHYTFKTIWDDGNFILSQAMPSEERGPILVVNPTHAQPTPVSIAQLEHAYALRGELDAAWAARPFELVRHQAAGTADEASRGRTSCRNARRAVGTDAVPARRHGLSGFSRSPPRTRSRSQRHQTGEHPGEQGDRRGVADGLWNCVARRARAAGSRTSFGNRGALPYMAPEQTGRMNRSIDSRSDLYAFGITMYEMLTSELPFTASDPMEWIHCHVARHPIPVGERVNGIPAVISEIVSKLMSKNAEEDTRLLVSKWIYGGVSGNGSRADRSICSSLARMTFQTDC